MQLSVRDIADILGVEPGFAPTLSAAERAALEEEIVSGAAIDSRSVREGDLFVCLAGQRVDGHDFALQALSRGAGAILAARDIEGLHNAYPRAPLFCVPDPQGALGQIAARVRRDFAGRVIGITGTAGKTTLKEWLFSLLSQEHRCARTEGNHNNQLGLPLTLCNTRGDEDFWIVEAGVSHAGDMEELASILRPDIGVVLNVGCGHTEGLGAMGVAWHKTRMFTLLARGGFAVASADYPDLRERALEACARSGARLYFFSVADSRKEYERRNREPGIGCVALVDGQNPRYCHLCVRRGNRVEETIVTMPMAGRAAAENLACVTLVAALLRLDLCFLQKAIDEARVPKHRYARVEIGKSVLIDDSYNANPLSMRRMLEAAAAEGRRLGRPLVPVLGAMLELGSEAHEAHRALGALLRALEPAFVLWKGPYEALVRSGLGPDIPLLSCETDEECRQAFSSLCSPELAEQGVIVLCKGSRSNRLEEAAHCLQGLLAAPRAN